MLKGFRYVSYFRSNFKLLSLKNDKPIEYQQILSISKLQAFINPNEINKYTKASEKEVTYKSLQLSLNLSEIIIYTAQYIISYERYNNNITAK